MRKLTSGEAWLKKAIAARLRARARLIEQSLLDLSKVDPEALVAQLQALSAESNFFQIQFFELKQHDNDVLSKLAGERLGQEIAGNTLDEETARILKITQCIRDHNDQHHSAAVEPIRRVR